MKRKEKATWSVGFIIIVVITRWGFLTVFLGGGGVVLVTFMYVFVYLILR